MSLVYVASDLHLGHKSICKYRTQFASADEHHNTILENIATVLGKRDTLLLLGDVAFSPEWMTKLFTTVVAHKIMMLHGNHDLPIANILHLKDLAQATTGRQFAFEIYGLHSYRSTWLSHSPIHSDEIRNRLGNIHGHTHAYNIPDERYFNASMENINYKPILFADIVSRWK
jgi:calcineurin-like phosphoesterase family protein